MFQENPLPISESSARQGIHMKNQALFSSKDKSKKLKCRLLQFLFGALRVNILIISVFSFENNKKERRKALPAHNGKQSCMISSALFNHMQITPRSVPSDFHIFLFFLFWVLRDWGWGAVFSRSNPQVNSPNMVGFAWCPFG